MRPTRPVLGFVVGTRDGRDRPGPDRGRDGGRSHRGIGRRSAPTPPAPTWNSGGVATLGRGACPRGIDHDGLPPALDSVRCIQLRKTITGDYRPVPMTEPQPSPEHSPYQVWCGNDYIDTVWIRPQQFGVDPRRSWRNGLVRDLPYPRATVGASPAGSRTHRPGVLVLGRGLHRRAHRGHRHRVRADASTSRRNRRRR